MPQPAPFPWIVVLIIFALSALNGAFAASELAIVSSRKPRLEAMARSGRRGARIALELANDSSRLLATSQIGITLIAIVSGAYSGEKLAQPLAERLIGLGLTPPVAGFTGLALAIGLTIYLSLVIGELVPKQIALRNPEAIAALAALPMLWLARASAPLVWLLDRSSALVFRLLRLDRETENHVTAEELHLIVAEASSAGVIEESERAIISGVVRLADRPVREVMTPRTDVDWIDADADPDELRDTLAAMPHSRLPVARGTVEDILGVVTARDIVQAMTQGRAVALGEILRPAPVVPDQMDAMDALQVLREAEVPMGLVHDEYGHFEGIITPADLLAAIAGVFASDQEAGTDPPVVVREDGSLLISGSYSADAMAERLGFDLPEDRDYATAAGFALSVLKRLPTVGELFHDGGWRFEIVDMDGRRIDKLLASPEGEGVGEG